MKIDMPVRRFLKKVFGTLKSGEERVHFHSQNLNEDRRGNPKGYPWHGRAWLAFHKDILSGDGRPSSDKVLGCHVEWVLGSKRARLSFEADPSDRELQFAWAIPPVAIWFTIEPGWKSVPWLWKLFARLSKDDLGSYGSEYEAREVSVYVHDWSIVWAFWHPTMSWKSKTSKWRHGSLDIREALFGKRVYREQTYTERKKVIIPMPEGEYEGEAKLYDAIYGYQRLPWKTRLSKVDIKVDSGIPFSGKGENSWDCGEDACYGTCGPARTIEEAIGKLVGNTLETRRKRGDPAKWPVYPPKKPTPPKKGDGEDRAVDARA
jgi:hypothetical protein